MGAAPPAEVVLALLLRAAQLLPGQGVVDGHAALVAALASDPQHQRVVGGAQGPRHLRSGDGQLDPAELLVHHHALHRHTLELARLSILHLDQHLDSARFLAAAGSGWPDLVRLAASGPQRFFLLPVLVRGPLAASAAFLLGVVLETSALQVREFLPLGLLLSGLEAGLDGLPSEATVGGTQPQEQRGPVDNGCLSLLVADSEQQMIRRLLSRV